MAAPIRVKGAEQLIAKLQKLERVTARAANRKATRAGTAVLAKAVKAETPVDEGMLKRSQTSKVTSKDLFAVGTVGADQDKLNSAHEEDKDRPTNIDWLVEYGHVAPDGRFVPPSGAMRRASAAAMPEAEAKYIAVLKAEIEGAV